ncbi:MAG: hypothetical protein AAF483_21975, partial [Planctomycetota bacterium]
APGINPNENTTLFLTGVGFSVHETRVIVGGKSVDYRLLSRECMEITVPPGAHILGGPAGKDTRIDVHIATPYGPSSHMLIPQVNKVGAVTVDTRWSPGAHQFTGQIVKDSDGKIDKVQNVSMNPAQPLGVYVPMELEGASPKIKMTLMIQTPQGVVPLSSKPDDLTASYDATQSVYSVAPHDLGSLLTAVQKEAAAHLTAGTIPANSRRITFLAKGTLEVGGNGYSIKGAMPITLELYE